MSEVRFEEIKRYLKISNPQTEGDPKTTHWIDKIKSILSNFLMASRRHLTPGRDVAIDEQLVGFRGRSRHTLTIASKEAGTGFKCYCLCSSNYLLSLRFTSKTVKISDFINSKRWELSDEVVRLPDTQAVVVELLQELSRPWQYYAYTDNFFTSIKLCNVLRKEDIALIGTCKLGSGIPESMLKLKPVSRKEKD